MALGYHLYLVFMHTSWHLDSPTSYIKVFVYKYNRVAMAFHGTYIQCM